ncbi:MAG TPA: diguanylate cyclase [Halothiobacillus sp.]|nr:diguanylate cyclase [Halothiobacillus sp.]
MTPKIGIRKSRFLTANYKSGRWFWLFNAPVAIMIVWVITSEVLEYRQSARETTLSAEQSATAYANSIQAKLGQQFTELEFAASLINTKGTPNEGSMMRFITLHPHLFAVNLFSADAKRILWSTYTRSPAPIVAIIEFTPIATRPLCFLGHALHAERYHGHILPMRYQIKDDKGKTVFFIGTPYRVDKLLEYTPELPWTFTIIDTRTNQIMGQWREGKINLNTEILPQSSVSTKIGVFPFVIHTSWPKNMVLDRYWQSAQQRWLMEIFMLVLLTAISSAALKLLRAREQANRRLQCLSDFNRMFAEINQIIATSERETELLQSVCDFGVAYGKLDLLWIGRPGESGDFNIIAATGPADVLGGRPPGHESARRAWTAERPFFLAPVATPPLDDDLQRKSQSLDHCAVACLPIRRQGAIWAILAIHHHTPESFDELNVLLEDLADDLSRGLDRLDLLLRERHSSALNQAILDNASAGILLIRDKVIYFANQRLVELIGASDSDEIIGHQLVDYFINPADQDQFLKQAQAHFDEGGQVKFEAQFRRQDGSIRWFSLTGKPFPEGRFDETWIVIDVTEHQLALNKQLLLASALAAVQEGVALTDHQQQIIYVNEAFSSQTGFSLSDVQGQTISRFLTQSPTPESPAQILKALAEGDTFQGQVPIHRKEGNPFWSLLTITPIRDDSSAISHYVMVLRDISALRQLNDRLLHLSLHDELTKLPNRRALEQHLHQRIGAMTRAGQMLAVGMIDLDDFKPVNDTWGHEAGDTLLRQLALRLQTHLREHDMLARLGGDEFVIVIEPIDPSDPESQITHVLQRLHEAVETPFEIGPNQWAEVGMSTGVALFPSDGSDSNTLLRAADAALYEIKMHKGTRQQWWQYGTRGANDENDTDPLPDDWIR